MMRRTQLPITALAAFSKLNDISFLDIGVHDLGEKGFGLVTERALSSDDTFDTPTLLLIPRELTLCAETIEEYAKADQHFRQLLDAAGGKSLRGDVLLFLLMQITIASPDHGQNVGLSNPWTEYVKMLPSEVPVPTLWNEGEQEVLLQGTSLESALNAKMAALSREFGNLRERTAEIPWCQKCWWESEALQFSDWLLVDAWYRSRCLELPNAGESMVPCLDMVNHSHQANAFYEETSNNSVALLLHRRDEKLEPGSEVTISYGTSKSQAEMLFSYGFIDEQSTTRSLVLTLEPVSDDPLGRAKLAAFGGPPIISISEVGGSITWESPFLYLMCLNEEDGLEFRILQQTDGTRSQLKVFWQGSDVTDATSTFEALISNHELKDVFGLRVVVLLQDRIRQQLERLYESEDTLQSINSMTHVSPYRRHVALELRKTETAILEAAFSAADMQKNKLLENEKVMEYLGMGNASEEQPQSHEANNHEEEDFS